MFCLVTKEVQDYILYYQHKGVLYEIHFIDSPGFDDGALADVECLKRIADYVNTTYRLKQNLAGVLYLYDITKGKIGRAGLTNLRMLEKMIGEKDFPSCTFITTKWGCSNDPQGEAAREEKLESEEDLFRGMLRSGASMKRFDPKTRERALDIITPCLENQFTLKISLQMADPRGPKLALGRTDAGKIVADHVDDVKKLAETNQELANMRQAQEILKEKYDETLFAEFKQKRKELRRKIMMQRSGRWIMRTTLVGGAIVATVFTLGPGASAFVLEPAYEKVVRPQRKAERKAKEDLKVEFIKRSQPSSRLKQIDPSWLDDNHVQEIGDLDSYSMRSGISDLEIAKVAQQGKNVGFAASEGSRASLVAADLPTSENSECSESDAESWGSDVEKDFIVS